MNNKNLGLYPIVIVAITFLIAFGVSTYSFMTQIRQLEKSNEYLAKRVVELSNRVVNITERHKSIVKEAINSATQIDDAYTQIHALSSKLHDVKLRLSSAKRMINRYTSAEKNVIATYITKRYHSIPKKLASDIATQTIKVAKEEQVPVSILVAIMDKESGFNPMATSPAGARGLMQVMPFWVKEFDFVKDKRELHDVYKGIKAGATVLRYGLVKANGDVKKALAIYKGPKYVAYINHILKLAGEFEIYKEKELQPIKSMLETFYVANPLKTIQSHLNTTFTG